MIKVESTTGSLLINFLLTSRKQSIHFSLKLVKKTTYQGLLKLTRLQIYNYDIERIPSIKFLGVLLDENLLWKDHIKYTLKNKISKNIGISYKTRDKESLLSLDYAYIHTYVNYANLAWASMICIIFQEDKFSHTNFL